LVRQLFKSLMSSLWTAPFSTATSINVL
jgi:hypothetical protein